MSGRVMEPDDVRRALTRIAHEIIERDKGVRGRRPGGHRRTAATTSRAASPREIERIEGCAVPVGVLDITFYRDDIGLRAEAPEVHETRIDFDVIGADGRARRRRPVHRPDDPRRRWTR